MEQLAKIITESEAAKIIGQENVVFISGTFDLIHLGHLNFFQQAKAKSKGATLIVAVLDDETVKSRKGPNRPINKLAERVEFLRNLKNIDYILPWHDWKRLRDFVLNTHPKYLAVVSGDQGIENKREHIEKAGGKLLLLDKFQSYSTTELIDRITKIS